MLIGCWLVLVIRWYAWCARFIGRVSVSGRHSHKCIQMDGCLPPPAIPQGLGGCPSFTPGQIKECCAQTILRVKHLTALLDAATASN